MNKIYTPWDIGMGEERTIRDLLRFGVLAPSSHNSQPWIFHVDNETISVSIETGRRLPASDPNDRQSTISIGCAIANIEIAADYYGYTCVVEESQEKPLIAKLRFSRKNSQHLNKVSHLANYISKRTTNRAPHQDRVLDEDVLKSIRDLGSESLRIDIVTERTRIRELGTVAIEAGIDAFEDKNFRYELSRYLKPNNTKSYVGMPGFGFGFPTFLSFVAPVLMRFFNMEKPARKQNKVLFNNTAAILVLSTPADRVHDWVSVGRVYEHIALLATRSDMASSPWAAVIQIGEHYRKVQEILGITGRPQMLFRLGYPISQISHSPRLPVESVTS